MAPFTRLYKYIKREHALSFFETGIIRIGTLYDYRNEELYSSEIGDNAEGTKSIISVDSAKSYSEIVSNPVLNSIIRAEPGAQINISNVQFKNEERSPNYYIFSMSESLDPKIAQGCDYDACIVIKDPQLFLATLSERILLVSKIKKDFILDRCQYTSRTQLFSRQHMIFPNMAYKSHPALIKDFRYSYQKEIRALWEPIGIDIQPRILQCPQAIQYCEISNAISL